MEKMKKILSYFFETLGFMLLVAGGMFFCLCIGSCHAQTNVVEREIVRRDTILATDYVKVEEYVTRGGNNSFKARWCGKAINISKSAAEDILGGSDAYVILCRYNNGEVIRNKVITLYSE